MDFTAWHQSSETDREALHGAIIESTSITGGGPLALVLRLRSGERYVFEIWADDEGNGPGVFVPVENLKRREHAAIRVSP